MDNDEVTRQTDESLLAYFWRGRKLSSPDTVTPRFRGELMRIMAVYVDSELAGASGFADCINLAPWIKCRTVVCNCLWDDVCPPSTIFAAYNHVLAEKQIEVYPFHKHEVPYEHAEVRFRMIVEMLRP